MNLVPSVKRVPGATWMRPTASCNSVASTQRHAPVPSRTKFLMNVSMPGAKFKIWLEDFKTGKFLT